LVVVESVVALIASGQHLGPTLDEQVTALLAHYTAVERYLLRCGVPPTRIDVHAGEAALDALHRTVIERIAACMRAVELE
jgi:hypothetical protein